MEKFSQFSTQGVNPFISSFEKASLAALAGCTAVILLKLPLILVATVALVTASALSALIPAAGAHWWRGIAVRAAARLSLFALGVWSIDTVAVEKYSIRSRASPASPRHDVRPGDVIVANHSSWVDVLVLAALYAPHFTKTSLEGGLRSCTIVEAMITALEPVPARLGPAARETTHLLVTTAALNGTGPLAVFPEVSAQLGLKWVAAKRRAPPLLLLRAGCDVKQPCRPPVRSRRCASLRRGLADF